MRNIDKIELATNKLENTFLEQKNIARKLMTEHRQLQDALAEYHSLLKDDECFADQWKDTDDDFNEWCENHNIVLVGTKERVDQLEEAQFD